MWRVKRDVGLDTGFVVENGPQPWSWPLSAICSPPRRSDDDDGDGDDDDEDDDKPDEKGSEADSTSSSRPKVH